MLRMLFIYQAKSCLSCSLDIQVQRFLVDGVFACNFGSHSTNSSMRTEVSVSKEQALAAAESGDAAAVVLFLTRVLPAANDEQSSSPEISSETHSKIISNAETREIVGTILDTAIANGQAEIIRGVFGSPVLCERLDMVMQTRWKQQLLVQAIYEDHVDIAKDLLAHGADPNQSASDVSVQDGGVISTYSDSNEDPRLPLCIATALGAIDVVELLISAGADANACCSTTSRCTAMFTAASHNEAEIMKLLLKANADPNTTHPVTRETPLHVAAKRSHVECVQLLLAATGVRLGALNHVGSSALHLAFVQGSGTKTKEVIRLLEAAGAPKVSPTRVATPAKPRAVT